MSDESFLEDESLTIDEFEEKLVNEHPELAQAVIEAGTSSDEPKKLSNKERERERRGRLQGMMLPGRNLFEQSSEGKAMDISMKAPYELLQRAVKNRLDVEVRTRSRARVDRYLTGKLFAFDVHMNLVMKQVTEVADLARHEPKRIPNVIPLVFHWSPHEDPRFPGEKVYQRHIKTTFVTGSTIVLIRLIPQE